MKINKMFRTSLLNKTIVLLSILGLTFAAISDEGTGETNQPETDQQKQTKTPTNESIEGNLVSWRVNVKKSSLL